MNQKYDIKKLLGARIKFLRKLRNFTQEALAEKIGIEPQSLSNIERGKFAPSIETLQNISEELMVEPYELYLFETIEPLDRIKKELIEAIEASDVFALEIYTYYKRNIAKTLR